MYEYVTLNIPSNRSLNEYFHIVNWMYDRYYVAQLTSGSHWLMTNFILIEHLLHPFGSSLVSTVLLSTSCVYLSWIPYGRESMQQLFWKWLISFIMLLPNITHVTIRISFFFKFSLYFILCLCHTWFILSWLDIWQLESATLVNSVSINMRV